MFFCHRKAPKRVLSCVFRVKFSNQGRNWPLIKHEAKFRPKLVKSGNWNWPVKIRSIRGRPITRAGQIMSSKVRHYSIRQQYRKWSHWKLLDNPLKFAYTKKRVLGHQNINSIPRNFEDHEDNLYIFLIPDCV